MYDWISGISMIFLLNQAMTYSAEICHIVHLMVALHVIGPEIWIQDDQKPTLFFG